MSLKLSDYDAEMFYPNTELLDLEYQKRKDEDGVSIDISNDEFLGILTYTKNHYDEAVSFFREIGDNKDVFHYFLNFSNPIFRPKGLQRIRFYKFMLDHFAIMSYLKGYTTGFKMVEHMDSYHDVMMQIFGYLNDASADDRKEYFDRAISNIEELKKLGISDVKMAIGYPKIVNFEWIIILKKKEMVTRFIGNLLVVVRIFIQMVLYKVFLIKTRIAFGTSSR